MGIGGWP